MPIWAPPHPPPVLYQHLKIVSGPFFGVKIRGVLGVSDPQKTHERPLAPVLKVIFVFRFWIFRLCGEVLGVFLTLRDTRNLLFGGGGGGGGGSGGPAREEACNRRCAFSRRCALQSLGRSS